MGSARCDLFCINMGANHRSEVETVGNRRSSKRPTGGAQLIHVETVDLATQGIRFPSDRVGMVIAQPHLPIEAFSAAEPYQLTPVARVAQLATIERTLAVAKSAPHGAAKTHFTVSTHVDAARHSVEHVGADRWVNCAITWVKAWG